AHNHLGVEHEHLRTDRRGRPATRQMPAPTRKSSRRDTLRNVEREARMNQLIGEATAIVALALADRTHPREQELVEQIANAARTAVDNDRAVNATTATMELLNDLTTCIVRRDPGLETTLRPDVPMQITSFRAISRVAADPTRATSELDDTIGEMRSTGAWNDFASSMPAELFEIARRLFPDEVGSVLLANAGDGKLIPIAAQLGLPVNWSEDDPDLALLATLRAAICDGVSRRPVRRGGNHRCDLVITSAVHSGARTSVNWDELERAREDVLPGGRIVAIVPTSGLATDDPVARRLVRDGAIEAVLDVFPPRGIVSAAVLVMRPEGEAADRIVFAKSTGPIEPHAIAYAVRDARFGLVVPDLAAAIDCVVVGTDKVGEYGRDGIDLTPSHRTAQAKLADPSRALEDAANAEGRVADSLDRVEASLAAVRKIHATRPQDSHDMDFCLLADLMAAPNALIMQSGAVRTQGARVAAAVMSSMPPIARLTTGSGAERIDGKPLLLDLRDARDGEVMRVPNHFYLQANDVVVWSTRDTTLRTHVVTAEEARGTAVALDGARVLRLTNRGMACELTGELLAFVIEASGRWIERTAARRSLGDIRFPILDPHAPIDLSVRDTAKRHQNLVAAAGAARQAEAELTIASSRVGYLRMVLAEYGGAGALGVEGYMRRADRH
ncbi:MAG: hypothetical protein WCQ48_07500, partial [Chloroflexota bacterium]